MADKGLNWIKYMALGSVISTTLAGLTVGGYFLGNFLDNCLGTDHLFKIVLIILGVFLGLIYLAIILLKFIKGKNE